MGSELSDLVLFFVFSLYLSDHILFNGPAVGGAKLVFGLFRLFLRVAISVLRNFPALVKGVVKAVVLAILAAFLGVLYLISSVVPFIGERTESAEALIKERLYSRHLELRVRRSREILVEILAKADDGELEYESIDRYREELSQAKREGKKRLERGETVLSLALGAVLIGSQATGIQIFRVVMYGVGLSFLVEVWLLLIAISIIYRVSVLELLSYPSDVDLESIEEFDAALSYQKMVAFGGFVQVLFLLMIYIWKVSSVRDDLIQSILDEKYRSELGFFEVMPFAWRELKKAKQGE